MLAGVQEKLDQTTFDPAAGSSPRRQDRRGRGTAFPPARASSAIASWSDGSGTKRPHLNSNLQLLVPMKILGTQVQSLFVAVSVGAVFMPSAVVRAQTTNVNSVITPPSFFASAENYFTSFNTNYTWTHLTLEAATGYKQVTGVNAASTLDVQRDFSGRWDVGLAAQFSGVGSPVNALQAQVGYALVEHFDTKLEADLRAGYDWTRSAAVAEPVLFIGKKLTPNTFLKTGVSLPIYSRGRFNRTPTFYLETGFTF